MNRYAFALLSVLAASSPACAQPKSGQGNGWLPNLAAGKAEAKRTGKPLMVAIRCVP